MATILDQQTLCRMGLNPSYPPVPRRSIDGYVNPHVLSSVTYHKMATVKATGATATSTYLYEASNSAYTFTDKFTISMWIQPKEIPSNNGFWLFSRFATDTNGQYLIRLEPQTVSSTNMYSLAIYNGGGNGYVYTKKADTSVLIRPFGHILINYDGTRTANDRIRFYVNGTDYTVAAGNLTANTNFAATMAANSSDIRIGGNTTANNCINAGISHIQIWSDDKWASRATIYNNGTPLPHASLGALNDSTLKRSVDCDDTIDESLSTRQYFRCKKNNVNALSPRAANNGSWLAQPTSYFASRINNLAPSGGYFSARFGSMPEYLHTSLRSNATTTLFNYGVLKSPLTNFSNLSSWTACEGLRYTGDITAVAGASHGDALFVMSHVGILTGTAGIVPMEQLYMGAVSEDQLDYVAPAIFPTVASPATAPMLPGIRQETPSRTGSANFSGVNVAAGDKKIHHYGVPPSKAAGTAYYYNTDLTSGVTTGGTHTGGSSGEQWFNDVVPGDFILMSYNRGTVIHNSECGIYVWGSGWSATQHAAIRTWIARQYGVTA